jgi:hypothetical protein
MSVCTPAMRAQSGELRAEHEPASPAGSDRHQDLGGLWQDAG